MWYGPMVDIPRLISGARPALVALFSAYQHQRKKGDDWRVGVKSDIAIPRFDPIFDVAQYSGAYSSAQCIAIVADNLARVWAFALFGNEHKRRRFGKLVNNVRFGKALWAAGNAARHYKGMPFYKATSDILKQLGVESLDEAAALCVLDAVGIHTLRDLLRDLESLCEEMEAQAKPHWRVRLAERLESRPFF
jgi:hypothetical protein